MISYLTPFGLFLFHLYLLQLEEYDVKRFLITIIKVGYFQQKQTRKKLVFTAKIKLLILLHLIELTFIFILFTIAFNVIVALIITIVLLYLPFLLIILNSIILLPLELYLKNSLVNKAKKKIQNLPNLKIIGITGSYGKTTMKESVYDLLSKKYKTVKTIGNNNTPIGIARVVLNKLSKDTEFFVVEMGEYVKGDVKQLCQITPPDISIITGINEAHLERYLTMENAISTKFEIAQYSKPNATVFINFDDKLIVENYKEYIPSEKNIIKYSANNNPEADVYVTESNFDSENLIQKFKLNLNNFESRTSIIAQYILGNISALYKLAELVEITPAQLQITIAELQPVPHRLQPTLYPNNILVIDDSYNGNSNGFYEGIKLLSKFANKRKIYCTPGLVETDFLNEEIHRNIGQELSNVADLVFLAKNNGTKYIKEELMKAGFNANNLFEYEDSLTNIQAAYKILQPNDVLMIQNDLPDNYV